MPSTHRQPRRVFHHAGRLLVALSCLSLFLSPVAQASGGSSAPSLPTVPKIEESPEQNAARHYEMGLKHRDKAWELEKKAAMADGAAAEKLMKKAQKEFAKAVKSQKSAITANPRMHQAHSSLGYALRRTGEFDESVKAYDRALEIEPGYTEAIEYRGEAYLALSRLEEAKEAYLTLLRSDKARADELMTAMKKWLGENEGGSNGISESELDAFSSWVEERAGIAGHAEMVLSGRTRDW